MSTDSSSLVFNQSTDPWSLYNISSQPTTTWMSATTPGIIQTTTPYVVSAQTKMAYVYTTVGTGGMISNLFILAVFLSDKVHLKQSAIMIGITISHFLCSFGIGVSGWYRSINAATTTNGVQLNSWICIARIYPAMLPFAFQSMGAMLILVGLERFTVFFFPHWYRIKCTNAACWRLVGLAYVCVLAAFGIGLYSVSQQAPTTSSFCPFQGLFGKNYYTYCSCVSATGGTIAVVLTMAGFIRGIFRARNLPGSNAEAGKNKRQLRLTRSMLSVVVLDFCLVVIPNVLYVVSNQVPALAAIGTTTFSNYTNVTYCVNTMMTLYPYLAFNKAFRTRAFRMIGCTKQVPSIQVEPATVNRVSAVNVARQVQPEDM